MHASSYLCQASLRQRRQRRSYIVYVCMYIFMYACIIIPVPGIAAAEAAASDLVEISPPTSARDRAPPPTHLSQALETHLLASAVRVRGASLSPDRPSALEMAGADGRVPLGVQREERREAGGGAKALPPGAEAAAGWSPGGPSVRRKGVGSRQRLVAASAEVSCWSIYLSIYLSIYR